MDRLWEELVDYFLIFHPGAAFAINLGDQFYKINITEEAKKGRGSGGEILISEVTGVERLNNQV